MSKMIDALNEIAAWHEKRASEPEFDYVIARPWDEDEPDHLCIYAYGTETHRGTAKDAQNLLDYVNRQGKNTYAIYRLTFQKIS